MLGIFLCSGRASAPRTATLPCLPQRTDHRDELVPAPRGEEGGGGTPREGLLGLLTLLDATSAVLTQLADSIDKAVPLPALGITLRDWRARWWSGEGRDPSLLALATNRDGDAIATYFYPPSQSTKIPVVVVMQATGEARWLADDFDAWFASVLFDAQANAPDAVRATLDVLRLAPDFPRPLATALPPSWFFEAHATSWTLADADTALAAGDVEGAERMLVAVGRTARASGLAGADVKMRLASVYTTLGWDHHRATVVETW
jgi:hypothetical protein